MSKIIGCNEKKIKKKELKKYLKKFKKFGFEFLDLCGCTKSDIRRFAEGEADLPDFQDVDEFEELLRGILGNDLFEKL